MKVEFINFGLTLLSIFQLTVCDTRFECIAGLGGNDGFGFGGDGFGGDSFGGDVGDNFGFGEGDEFEGFGESENEGFGGMMGIQTAMGSLTCPTGSRGSILVKRVTYGVGAFPGTCQPSPFCGVQHDAGESVGKKCDGKSTCSVNILQPKMMSCGRMSNYMHVEYECVDTWATYEICETITTIAKSASIIITSPGYLGTSNLKSQDTRMCECIIQSHDRADMYMDYLQTQLASEGHSCPYEFVLIESKKNLTQSSNDRELEVCGNRHVNGEWFEGSIRITYASGGSMEKRGLLAKFTVDNIGNTPMIEMECGKVSTKNLKLQKRPPGKQKPPSSSFFPSGMSGLPMLPGGMPMFPTIPSFTSGGSSSLDIFPNRPPSSANTNSKPDFSQWKINVGSNKQSSDNSVKVRLPSNMLSNPGSSAAANKPNAPAKLVPSIQRPDRGGKPTRNTPRNGKGKQPRKNKKAGARAAVSEDESAVSGVSVDETKSGSGHLALTLSAVGAVLILGSVGVLALHNYRKRQRIRKEEAAYASGGSMSCTYGKGWTGDNDAEEESVYATVAEVNMFRNGCVNPAVDTSYDLRETTDDSVVRKIIRSGNHDNPVAEDVDDDKYDKLSLKEETGSKSKIKNQQGIQTEKHVTVIEVHKRFEETDSDSLTENTSPVLHTSACLDSCMYAAVGSSGNKCSECNIVRPPRRRDTERSGYDNNVSVKTKQSKHKDIEV